MRKQRKNGCAYLHLEKWFHGRSRNHLTPLLGSGRLSFLALTERRWPVIHTRHATVGIMSFGFRCYFNAILAVGWVARPIFAADYSGTAAYSFLSIPVGARATGMGQAFTSVPNDIQGLSYNPACLVTMAASQASLQHLNYVDNVTQEAIA